MVGAGDPKVVKEVEERRRRGGEASKLKRSCWFRRQRRRRRRGCASPHSGGTCRIASCSLTPLKGHLSKEIIIDSTTRHAFAELRKTSTRQINDLSTLIVTREKRAINFDEMDATMQPLIQVTTRLGAKRLKSQCENFIEFCKLKDKKRCNTMLFKIQAGCSDVCFPFEILLELQELIQLVERMIERAESGVPDP